MLKNQRKVMKLSAIIVLLFMSSLNSALAQETYFDKVNEFIKKTISIPETTNLIIEKFGQPDSLISQPITNKYDSTSMDTIYRFYYNGFEFETYCVTKTKKCLLTVFILHSNKFRLPFDVKLGMSKTDIENIFGKPVHENNEALIYNDDAELTSHLQFFFSDDNKLMKIVWFQEE